MSEQPEISEKPPEAPDVPAPVPAEEPPPVAPVEVPGADSGSPEGPLFDDEDVVPDPNERQNRRFLPIAAVVFALLTFFGVLSKSGIWEPHELKVADLSRRIAVGLFGATKLQVGADNIVPTAPELGRGELPFTSIALALKVFGLTEWAGRLPMALWGLAGALAVFWLVDRLVDRVAASFSLVALATMPLYFLQARTILGDIVAMSGLAIAVAGLAIAVFDARLGTAARFGSWLLGAAGMGAAYGARGVLVGVALPSFAIGIAWLLRRDAARADALAGIFGTLTLALGACALFLGVRALLGAEDRQYVRLLGATVEPRHSPVTHDVIIHQLGHSLFPWSAFVPFAFGRILRAPLVKNDDAFERESSVRIVLIVFSALALGVYTALAPSVGPMPFGGVFALAAAVGICFRDFERGAPPSRAIGIGVLALLVLFYTDFKNFPEKGLAPFVVDDAKFPDSFKDLAKSILEKGTVVFGGLFALFFFERDEGQKAFKRPDYALPIQTLNTVANGNVAFVLIGLEVALALLAGTTFLSDKKLHLPTIETMAMPVRLIALFGFIGLPLLVLLPLLALGARDAARVVLRWVKLTRGSAALLSLAAFGATMSFVYYPTLARQISPKEVFESYQKLAKPGEELAMMGSGTTSSSARYYAHGDVKQFTNVTDAFSWLTGPTDARRFLIVRSADIGQLNSQFRARQRPAHNLPVLDGRSSEILLASNRLLPGETNENPFAKWVLDEKPVVQHPLDVDFNGQLHGFGWAVTDKDGKPVPWVRAGKRYELRFFYEVTRPISGEWQTFVHIDGFQKRFNGDHDTLEGKYQFHLWRPGDFIVDIHPFELEPNFTAGTYTVFFGLFRGDQRLEVKRGAEAENRVNAGPIEVR